MLGAKNQTAIITQVERASRFTLIRRLPADHLTGTVIAELVAMMNSLPQALRNSLDPREDVQTRSQGKAPGQSSVPCPQRQAPSLGLHCFYGRAR